MHLLFLPFLQEGGGGGKGRMGCSRHFARGGKSRVRGWGMGSNTSEVVVPCCTVGIFSCWLMYLYLVNT